MSHAEPRRTLESFHLLDGGGFGSVETLPLPAKAATLYDAIFKQLDPDHSGTVDHAEIHDHICRIILAVSDVLFSEPLQILVDNKVGSFLLEAGEHEDTMITAKVQVESRKAVVEADNK
ncbi:hypothetical protein ACQ4PT_003288 [Festuca glaucescens]